MSGLLNLATFCNGMFLPNGCENAQDTADAGAHRGTHFYSMQRGGKVAEVMEVLPQGAGTSCLIRYPSPIGRPCDPKHRPPTFHEKLHNPVFQRKVAQIKHMSDVSFDHSLKVGFYAPRYKRAYAIRGSHKCKSNVSRFHYWQPLQGFPPAAIPLHNRGLSVPVPVRVRRLYSVVVSGQVWLSARPAMSPTVRLQKDANLNERLFRGARFMSQQAIGALRSGGLSYVASRSRKARLRTGGRDTYVR